MKFFKILAMAILTSFLVMGCSGSSSSDHEDISPPDKTIPFTKEMIVGTFYLYDDDDGYQGWTKIDIEEDGTSRYKNSKESGNGAWEIVEGKVVFTFSDGDESTYALVSQTETSYEMYGVDEDGGYYETWYKQQKFTKEMLVGNSYHVEDEDNCDVRFEEDFATVICSGDDESVDIDYIIDGDGVLVADDDGEEDKHYLIKLENDGFRAWNDDEASRWVLQD